MLQNLIDVDAQMFLLLELLRGHLLPAGDVSGAYLRDETSSHEKLIELFEKVPLSELTPEKNKARLRKLSEHRRDSCIRMLRRLFNLLATAGGKIDNPWKNCEFTDAPKRRTYVSCVNRDIEQICLTNGQINCLIQKIPKRPTGSFQDGILLASLLMAIESVSPDEICGINVEDVKPLSAFPDRWTISLHRVFTKSNKRHYLEEMGDTASIRVLSLPQKLNPLIRALCKGKNEKDHLFRQEDHSSRRMTPELLTKEICNLLKPLDIKKETNVMGSKPPGGIPLLLNTAEAGLRRAGYEDEELRNQQGKSPLLTSAISYCDFKNQVQLNKMGALQDRWLNNVMRPEFLPRPVRMKSKQLNDAGATIAPIFYSNCIQAELEAIIDLTELNGYSDEFKNLALHLHSGYGADIQIWLEEVKDNEP